MYILFTSISKNHDNLFWENLKNKKGNHRNYQARLCRKQISRFYSLIFFCTIIITYNWLQHL